MDSRFVPGAVIAAVLLALGIIACACLEVYPRSVRAGPSREAAANDYLALERWLAKTGHPVRIEKRGELSRIVSGPEKTAFIRASGCAWKNAADILLPWIEAGGFLLISVDPDFENEDFAAFLAGLGINTGDDDSGDEGPAGADSLSKETPDFDRRVRFFVDRRAGAKMVTTSDRGGLVRLVRVSLGKGTLALTGRPRFMFNAYLDREINARLAWDLTGARTGDVPGLVFFRNRRVTKGLFGKIADRGNFPPLLVSVLLLVVLGFWMIIPVFGLVSGEKRTQARPIRERFLAETRFLKKYGALQSYLETYIRELKLRGRNGENAEIAEIEQALRTGRPLKYRDILKYLRKLGAMISSKTERGLSGNRNFRKTFFLS